MLSQQAPRLGGPLPKFNDFHVWMTLYYLNEFSPIGRKGISTKLGIGEGSTRTIITLLQENGIVSTNKNGVSLTPEGVDFWNTVYMEMRDIQMNEVTIGSFDCVIRVPGMAKRVQYGCEERDTAIVAGATGATTLICSNNVLIFPGSNYPVDPKVEKKLRSSFEIRDDDVIIIGTGSDKQMARVGAVTAGLELLGGLRIKKELDGMLSNRSTGNELLALAFAIHDLVGGLPVCAKSRDNLGIRIESGAVIDNAYTGAVLEEVIEAGTTIRKIAVSGPYKGIRVIVTPVELNNMVIAAIGVVDIRTMAGVNNLIRLKSDENE